MIAWLDAVFNVKQRSGIVYLHMELLGMISAT
jgi:hypothetical protein